MIPSMRKVLKEIIIIQEHCAQKFIFFCVFSSNHTKIIEPNIFLWFGSLITLFLPILKKIDRCRFVISRGRVSSSRWCWSVSYAHMLIKHHADYPRINPRHHHHSQGWYDNHHHYLCDRHLENGVEEVPELTLVWQQINFSSVKSRCPANPLSGPFSPSSSS